MQNQLRTFALKVLIEQTIISSEYRNTSYILQAREALSYNTLFELRKFCHNLITHEQSLKNQANFDYISLAKSALQNDLLSEYDQCCLEHDMDNAPWQSDLNSLEVGAFKVSSVFPEALRVSLLTHLQDNDCLYLLNKCLQPGRVYGCLKELHDCIENDLSVDNAYVISGFPHMCGKQSYLSISLKELCCQLVLIDKPFLELDNFLITEHKTSVKRFNACFICPYQKRHKKELKKL